MKIDKEKIKQIMLIISGIFLICVGYFNYSLDFTKKENTDLARQKG